jgi:hypothetical protein
MDEVQNPAIPSDMHRRQNRLESSRLKVFENGAKKNICSSEENVTRGRRKYCTERWIIFIICNLQVILLG